VFTNTEEKYNLEVKADVFANRQEKYNSQMKAGTRDYG
jgi:hypothetical protein